MPSDRTGTDSRNQILRSLGFLLVLSVVGAAYPVAMEQNLSWRFWAGLGGLLATNLVFFCRKGRCSPALVFLLDTILVGLLFAALGERAPEFYILFALTLLVAAAGRRPACALAATVSAGALYVFLLHRNAPAASLLTGAVLTRLSFFFAYSLFIAFLGSEFEKAQCSARESEAKYRTLADALPEVVFEADRNGRITYANARGFELFGYGEADLAAGLPLLDMIAPEDRPRAGANMARVLGGDTRRGTQYAACRKDGTRFPISIHSAPIARQGGIVGLRGIVVDMTELSRVEQALQEERDRARAYLDVAEVLLLVLSPSGEVVLINRKGCRILGYSEADLAGRSWIGTCVRPADRAGAAAVLRDRIAGSGDPDACQESHVVTRDGKERLIAWRTALLRDRAGAVVGMIQSGEDITERKRLEEQLRQAHKMEAVGQLAGGIAHDFNNLLMVMNGHADILLGRPPDAEEARLHLDVILKTGERAALLTRQLLAFSRRQVLQPRPLDLNEVVNDMDRMLRRVIPENILTVTALTPVLWHALADRGQIEQAILNLAINARDAMPNGGTLTFETANATLDATTAGSQPFDVRPGPYVLLAVRDTGCGMPEHVKDHLFEPFYTTKPAGAGTGLGLATVFGIIKQSNGHIEVKSEEGRGTTIRLYLPRCAGAATGRGETTVVHLARGTETILLVEDMDEIRELVREQLTTLGYAVHTARNGKAALEEVRRNGPIQMLLTDVVMPLMNGSELARHLREICPGVKVLFMSGYPEPPPQGAPVEHYIQKPVNLDSLSRKIRAVLDGDRAAGDASLERSR